MIRVRCSHCPQVYQVPEERLGTQATCRKCQHTFTLEMSADETGVQRAKPISTMPMSGSTTALPRKLGQYELKQKLGAGAMGDVWLAHDAALQRDTALKLMSPGIASDPERRQRFEREARTAARLLHPNTVAVYSFGIEGDHAYLAMELVNGSSLDKVVSAAGPLPWREATRAICDAAKGLAAAHEIGLVHRDIKPANLMRTAKGVTKVVDFGLARTALNDTQLTQEGTLLGTPAYMAPEQWMGGEVDARSDLYSLICTYYFLLTGKLPFNAPSLPALGYQHRYEPFPDPRQFAADLPDAVCRILARGAQKDPSQRYQSADELVAELESVLSSPDQSLLQGGSWQGLLATGGNLTPVPQSSSTAADFSLPSLVVTRRTAKRSKSGTNPMIWIATAATGGLALLVGVIVYVTANQRTTDGEVDQGVRTTAAAPSPLLAAPLPDAAPATGQKPSPEVRPTESTPVVTTPASTVPPSTPAILPAASGVPADARQFGGNSYKFFAEHLSWKEAKSKCEGAGGHLVVIESAAEQKFVSDLIAATAWQDSWIGITDEASEGKWMTVTGKPVGYSNWFVNQPNNKGASEHFALMSNRTAGQDINWRWCDQPSQAQEIHQPGYVCEWEPNSPSSAAAAPLTTTSEWTPLFNGKDLAGWATHPNQPGGWTVENGELVGRSSGANHLFYERALYGNFHLRAEVKLNDRGNSGVYFRGNFAVSRNGRYPDAYEAQLVNQNPGMPLTGSLRMHGGQGNDPTYIPTTIRPDEWFTLEIIADGNHLTIKINDRVTTDVVDSANLYSIGHIALQAMAGVGSAPTVVHFRKIEIKELPARSAAASATSAAANAATVAASSPAAPASSPAASSSPKTKRFNQWVSLFNGKDLAGWRTHPDDSAKWEVRNGWLTASGGRGHLFTERDDYENFHFRVEARINDVGNSGQYFRAAYSSGFLKGYEAQISTVQGDQKTGSLYNFVRIPQQLHAPGVSFTQEIIASGNHIQILVNGRRVVDFRDPANTYTKGHLALQQNGAASVVMFRNIEVKELRKAVLEPISELNTPDAEGAPWISADGLRIYWEHTVRGEDPTIWQAERASPDARFSGKRLVAHGRQPALTPDELQMVVIRRGGQFGKSLFKTSRASLNDTFGADEELTQLGKLGFNNPFISADGRALFVNGRPGGPITATQYHVARRPNVNAPWSKPVTLDVRWNATAQAAPLTWLAMAPDELSFLATHELDIGRFRVVRFSRAAKTFPFANFEYLSLPSIPTVYGRTPRYSSATKELFLSAPPDYNSAATVNGWQAAPPDLWVIRNVEL